MGKKLHPGRILYDLKSIKGYFNCVPKDIAPMEDKGIYFVKAMNFLDDLIQKYEIKVEQYREQLKSIGNTEQKDLELIREILLKINTDNSNSGWDKASYSELIAFCFNKTITYFKEHYPEQMFEMFEKKLICPECWTKEQKAEFLGINLEGLI